MFGTNERKTPPESDPFQTIAAPRQREEGDEHPGLHLGDPFLRLILLAAASRRFLFIVPFLIAGEEVGARAERRRDVTAGYRAPCAQPRRRGCGAAGALVRVVEAVGPGLRVRAVVVRLLPPRRRRGGRACARLAVPVRARRLQRHVLDLKPTKNLPSIVVPNSHFTPPKQIFCQKFQKNIEILEKFNHSNTSKPPKHVEFVPVSASTRPRQGTFDQIHTKKTIFATPPKPTAIGTISWSENHKRTPRTTPWISILATQGGTFQELKHGDQPGRWATWRRASCRAPSPIHRRLRRWRGLRRPPPPAARAAAARRPGGAWSTRCTWASPLADLTQARAPRIPRRRGGLTGGAGRGREGAARVYNRTGNSRLCDSR